MDASTLYLDGEFTLPGNLEGKEFQVLTDGGKGKIAVFKEPQDGLRVDCFGICAVPKILYKENGEPIRVGQWVFHGSPTLRG
jgi:hypothetical protein